MDFSSSPLRGSTTRESSVDLSASSYYIGSSPIMPARTSRKRRSPSMDSLPALSAPSPASSAAWYPSSSPPASTPPDSPIGASFSRPTHSNSRRTPPPLFSLSPIKSVKRAKPAAIRRADDDYGLQLLLQALESDPHPLDASSCASEGVTVNLRQHDTSSTRLALKASQRQSNANLDASIAKPGRERISILALSSPTRPLTQKINYISPIRHASDTLYAESDMAEVVLDVPADLMTCEDAIVEVLSLSLPSSPLPAIRSSHTADMRIVPEIDPDPVPRLATTTPEADESSPTNDLPSGDASLSIVESPVPPLAIPSSLEETTLIPAEIDAQQAADHDADDGVSSETCTDLDSGAKLSSSSRHLSPSADISDADPAPRTHDLPLSLPPPTIKTLEPESQSAAPSLPLDVSLGADGASSRSDILSAHTSPATSSLPAPSAPALPRQLSEEPNAVNDTVPPAPQVKRERKKKPGHSLSSGVDDNGSGSRARKRQRQRRTSEVENIDAFSVAETSSQGPSEALTAADVVPKKRRAPARRPRKSAAALSAVDEGMDIDSDVTTLTSSRTKGKSSAPLRTVQRKSSSKTTLNDASLSSLSPPQILQTTSDGRDPCEGLDLSALLIDALVFGRLTFLSAPDLAKNLMRDHPHLLERLDTVAAWTAIIRSVLEAHPVFGRIPRHGLDPDGKKLEDTWYYEPSQDPDRARAQTMADFAPSKRRKAKMGDRTYFYAPIDMNRWVVAAELGDDA